MVRFILAARFTTERAMLRLHDRPCTDAAVGLAVRIGAIHRCRRAFHVVIEFALAAVAAYRWHDARPLPAKKKRHRRWRCPFLDLCAVEFSYFWAYFAHAHSIPQKAHKKSSFFSHVKSSVASAPYKLALSMSIKRPLCLFTLATDQFSCAAMSSLLIFLK